MTKRSMKDIKAIASMNDDLAIAAMEVIKDNNDLHGIKAGVTILIDYDTDDDYGAVGVASNYKDCEVSLLHAALQIMLQSFSECAEDKKKSVSLMHKVVKDSIFDLMDELRDKEKELRDSVLGDMPEGLREALLSAILPDSISRQDVRDELAKMRTRRDPFSKKDRMH